MSRSLKIAHAHVPTVIERYFDNDSFNQHLRQHDIQLGNDVFDHFHVLLRSKNQQGISALVGDHFRRAQNLEFSGAARGAPDNVLQPVAETGARPRRGAGCDARAGWSAKSGRRCAGIGAAGASAGLAETTARRSTASDAAADAAGPAADGGAAAARAQGVQRTGDFCGLRIPNRDDFRDVFGGRHHVDFVDHLQHAFDVLGEVAQHQNLAAVNRQNGIGNFDERLQHLDQLAGLGIFQLHHVRYILAHIG